jgi:hypothetical protein
VVISPDGRNVLPGSWDQTAKLWTLEGAEVRNFTGHTDAVSSVAFSPDGRYVLTGSSDKTAKLWTLEGAEVRAFTGHTDAVSSVAFSPDGRYVLTGSGDKTAKLWTLEGAELRTFTSHTDAVSSAAFSPDGRYVLTGSSDKTAKLWTLEGAEERTFTGHTAEVWSVAFSPDGRYVLTGSGDKTAKLWTLEGLKSGQAAEIFSFPGFVSSFCPSPVDEFTFLVGTGRKFALIFNNVVRLEKKKGMAGLTVTEKIAQQLMGERDCFESNEYSQLVEGAKFFLVSGLERDYLDDEPKFDSGRLLNAQKLAQKAIAISPGGEAEVVLEDVFRYLKMAKEQEEDKE